MLPITLKWHGSRPRYGLLSDPFTSAPQPNLGIASLSKSKLQSTFKILRTKCSCRLGNSRRKPQADTSLRRHGKCSDTLSTSKQSPKQPEDKFKSASKRDSDLILGTISRFQQLATRGISSVLGHVLVLGACWFSSPRYSPPLLFFHVMFFLSEVPAVFRQ